MRERWFEGGPLRCRDERTDKSNKEEAEFPQPCIAYAVLNSLSYAARIFNAFRATEIIFGPSFDAGM